MPRFGEDGNISAAEAGRRSKRGPSLKKQVRNLLDANGEVFTELVSRMMKDMIKETDKGDYTKLVWFLEKSGVIKYPEESIVANGEVDLSKIEINFGIEPEEGDEPPKE